MQTVGVILRWVGAVFTAALIFLIVLAVGALVRERFGADPANTVDSRSLLASFLAQSDNDAWLPLSRSEITQLTVGAANTESLKIETTDVQKAKLTGFLPPNDTIWIASNPAIPLAIVLAGLDQNVDSLRITLPVVDYSHTQADRVFAILAVLFKRVYPEWADAPKWPSNSLLEAWKKGSVSTKEIGGITSATFGVPPDVVVYTITTRAQCVPNANRGNPFQRPIC
jgi:hypothetical protein